MQDELSYPYCKFLGGGGALISKILLFGGVLFREGRLSESGRSLDHLRYRLQPERQSGGYSTINTAHAFMGLGLSDYGEQI